MSRKIKFRAWNIKTKTMIDLHKITPLALSESMNSQLALQGMDGLFIPFHENLILEQFTGLHDKNGKEIYEGDILKDDSSDVLVVRFGKLPLDKSGDCVCTYPAFYCEDKGGLGYAPVHECREIGNWMEVIGNIHENPEILERQSNG